MKQEKGFTVIELMVVVVIAGLLAAVAVPAFMRHIRRTKTAEATMNVRKLFDSSVAYYEAKHDSAEGVVLARQFPTGATLAPAQRCCVSSSGSSGSGGSTKGKGKSGGGGGGSTGGGGGGGSGASGKCAPTPTTFQDAAGSWAALNFSVDDPFYFQYQYVSAGTDTDATFEAYAFGDLDCDGTLSTYMRAGSVLADWSVIGNAGLFTKDAVE